MYLQLSLYCNICSFVGSFYSFELNRSINPLCHYCIQTAISWQYYLLRQYAVKRGVLFEMMTKHLHHSFLPFKEKIVFLACQIISENYSDTISWAPSDTFRWAVKLSWKKSRVCRPFINLTLSIPRKKVCSFQRLMTVAHHLPTTRFLCLIDKTFQKNLLHTISPPWLILGPQSSLCLSLSLSRF